MDNWLNVLFEGDYGGVSAGLETALLVTLLAFVIGHFIGWIYMWTHRGLSYSHTFVASLVVVPVNSSTSVS